MCLIFFINRTDMVIDGPSPGASKSLHQHVVQFQLVLACRHCPVYAGIISGRQFIFFDCRPYFLAIYLRQLIRGSLRPALLLSGSLPLFFLFFRNPILSGTLDVAPLPKIDHAVKACVLAANIDRAGLTLSNQKPQISGKLKIQIILRRLVGFDILHPCL